MNRLVIVLLAALCLAVVGCDKKPPENPKSFDPAVDSPVAVAPTMDPAIGGDQTKLSGAADRLPGGGGAAGKTPSTTSAPAATPAATPAASKPAETSTPAATPASTPAETTTTTPAT